ncbi:Sodium/proton antiporter 1 [Vitis vinifera]|uniref:Sodium/proton antiporter 1 n=1 Tax=Vitis vinifera TaxID=29760 RepID=A0A438FN82_VITVI|nr:Sodium/proton antiporter 1 [Vitis vinifera]
MVRIAGKGTKIKFWTDVWCTGTTLSQNFPHLFALASHRNATVPSLEEDLVFWKGGRNGQFRVKEAYSLLANPNDIAFLSSCIWVDKVPTKVGFVTFFLSSILDNLTTTIIMVSLLRKLVPPSEFRKYVLKNVQCFLMMGIRYNKALGKNFRPDEVPVVFLYCFSPFLWRLSRHSILGIVPGGLSEGEAQSKCLEALSDNSRHNPKGLVDRFLGAVVVIAANAGGAWTPIGDVTTSMLWIHGQISTLQTMKGLFIPSAVSLAVPLALMSLTSEVNGKGQDSPNVLASEQMAPRGQLVFAVGVGALVFVPVFKAVTGLPPFMGILLGLGVLWILTDAIHYGESERQRLKVPQALSRIDTEGVLFFLGILLSVSSLEAAGILRELANYLDAHIPNVELIASSIGVVSAIIDNVPLVAATMGMYDLTSYPQDSEFWQLIAYCAGTGGSMLVIGSAAGVAFMGMEKVDFFWYLRKVSGFAFAGYAAGIAAYLALHNLHISTTLAHVPFFSGS